MIDYIIEIKINDATSIYHNIISIELFETFIRLRDRYGIIYHVYTRDKSPIIHMNCEVVNNEC